jgi:hypothetical protein
MHARIFIFVQTNITKMIFVDLVLREAANKEKPENENFNAHVANRSAVFILLATKYNTHNVNIAQFF